MFSQKRMTESAEVKTEKREKNEFRAAQAAPVCAEAHKLREMPPERTAPEAVFAERRPEQILSDIANRLCENGYTQENWERMDRAERADALQNAAKLIAQEMLLPPDIRENLRVSFSDRPRSGHTGLQLDKGILELDDAAQVYAELRQSLSRIPEPDRGAMERTESLASAEAALSRLEAESFAAAYQQASGAVAFEGGMSASQGLRLMADANFKEAARLRGRAASLSREASKVSLPQSRKNSLLASANSANAKANDLVQSGKRLANAYNNAVKNAQRGKS